MGVKKGQRSKAIAGEEYDYLPCPFCGSPSPVFTDKYGRPYCRCQACGSRCFGSTAALTLSQHIGRVVVNVPWPPKAWPDAGIECHG